MFRAKSSRFGSIHYAWCLRGRSNRVLNGVVLSGNLDDGTSGLVAIKRCGGVAVVQDPSDALFSEMPQSAVDVADVDYCVKLPEMAALPSRLAHDPPGPPMQPPGHEYTAARLTCSLRAGTVLGHVQCLFN